MTEVRVPTNTATSLADAPSLTAAGSGGSATNSICRLGAALLMYMLRNQGGKFFGPYAVPDVLTMIADRRIGPDWEIRAERDHLDEVAGIAASTSAGQRKRTRWTRLDAVPQLQAALEQQFVESAAEAAISNVEVSFGGGFGQQHAVDPKSLSQIGSLDSACPHCRHPLKPRPKRKKKCPKCGEYMFARTRPTDNEQILVTAAQAEQIEEQWAIVNGTHEEWIAERQRVERTRADLRRQLGRNPSESDLKWRLINEERVLHAKDNNWGLYRNSTFEMAELLRKDERPKDALVHYLEVCYLDLNGPKNIGDLAQWRQAMRGLMEVLPEHRNNPRALEIWDPEDPTADLAIGVTAPAQDLAIELGLGHDQVEALFVERMLPIMRSLELPLSPQGAWQELTHYFDDENQYGDEDLDEDAAD
jgi:hypothetical protein